VADTPEQNPTACPYPGVKARGECCGKQPCAVDLTEAEWAAPQKTTPHRKAP
jgi:hypothetical protein